jgi:catechol 2,3-dioxygenase-like lactoylglutathione lyase family enzyme
MAESGLNAFPIVACLMATDVERVKKFYGETLGLPFVRFDGFAAVFEAHGNILRVAIGKEVTPAKFTVLGWEVSDIRATVEALSGAGVKFDRYPGMEQDELGIWDAPGGDKVAWFKDPDGNVLSLSQHRAG